MFCESTKKLIQTKNKNIINHNAKKKNIFRKTFEKITQQCTYTKSKNASMNQSKKLIQTKKCRNMSKNQGKINIKIR